MYTPPAQALMPRRAGPAASTAGAPSPAGAGAAGAGAVAGGDRPGRVRRTFGVLRGTAARARSPIVRALATAGARGCP